MESYQQTEGLFFFFFFYSVEDVKYNGQPKEKKIEEIRKNHTDKKYILLGNRHFSIYFCGACNH